MNIVDSVNGATIQPPDNAGSVVLEPRLVAGVTLLALILLCFCGGVCKKYLCNKSVK